MEVLRPYNAEDNEVNKACVELLTGYAKKNNEVITRMSIYGKCVNIETESGRVIYASETNGCRSSHQNVRQHLYMAEYTTGKTVRIKKENW